MALGRPAEITLAKQVAMLIMLIVLMITMMVMMITMVMMVMMITIMIMGWAGRLRSPLPNRWPC